MTTKYIIHDLKTGFTYEYNTIDAMLIELKSFIGTHGIQQFEIIKLEELN